MPQNISNFGGNVTFAPERFVIPKNEQDLLTILDENRGQKIRVIGRLHSWSELPVTNDLLIDIQLIDQVQVEKRGDRIWATAGAGCQIKQLLIELENQAGATLPSVGLITQQTIAGAAATGTHGSGKHSLSHYIDEVRIATYDPVTGDPGIRVISSGPELQAARCSLGAMGVIVSVGFWCRPQYQVEEHFRRYEGLTEVIAAEKEYPLQQFFLVPWMWQYFVQHRREVPAKRSRLASLYRWYSFLVLDIGLHVFVTFLARRIRSRRCIRLFFRYIAPLTIIRRWNVADKSQDMLVMKHELFRHIEIEVFVKQSRLADSLVFVTELLKHFDGDDKAIGASTRQQLESHGLWSELAGLRGSYTHHYPICVRRVLTDDTLISMASGDESCCYAISFISYARPTDRQSFMQFAESLSASMAALFDGRPHWGKVCPLSADEVSRLYPDLPQFQEVCKKFDSTGVFRNEWLNRILFDGEPATNSGTNMK